MTRRILFAALTCLGLASCTGDQHSDLKQFVKDSDNLPRGRIAPLPDVQPYEPFSYEAFGLLDPFKPRKIDLPKAPSGVTQPDQNRRKEPLEAYPLENLRMVGTLQQSKTNYALVKSPDNNLFRVRPGNYMGQNFGLITEVSESSIKLKEVIRDDGTGELTERISTLTLVDEAGK